jgi:periplasmic protein TonB
VSFQRVAAKPEPPPPPPPPKPIPKPRRKVALPAPAAPAPPQVVTPKVIPKEAPKAEATNIPQGAVAVSSGVTTTGGTGDVGGAEPAVDLPEEATPPQLLTQTQPAFPEEARKAGREGLVILKFIVTRQGRAASVKVLKGEPPFVDAALAFVKSMLFKPATVNGAPIAVFKILRIPFKLSVGG